MVVIEMNGLVTEIQGLIEHFPSPLKPSELLATCKRLELFKEQYFTFDARNLQGNAIDESKAQLILAREFYAFSY
jgi:hypothetical protein